MNVLRRNLILILLMLSTTVWCQGRKVAVLSELLKPDLLTVDQYQLYVAQGATAFIYSLKDYKLIKSFGKRGEGPTEFKVAPQLPIFLMPVNDEIVINSIGKLSFFTKKGAFKREMKTIGFNMVFLPIGKKFAGIGIKQEDRIIYRTLNLYGSDLKLEKEFFRAKRELQLGAGTINILERSFSFYTYDNKIFVSGKKGFVIDVFDEKANFMFSINREYQPLTFSNEDEKNYLNYLKSHPSSRNNFENIKHRLHFPETYPVIYTFFVSANKVYILTYKKKDNKNELFIYDTKGKFIKATYITVLSRDPVEPFPMWIENQKLYQLVENENEEWELHIVEIK